MVRKQMREREQSEADLGYAAGIDEQELAIDASLVLFDMDWSN